jgi:hypothetical protein
VKTRSRNNGREFFSAVRLASERNGRISSGSSDPEVNIPMDFSAREFSHGLPRPTMTQGTSRARTAEHDGHRDNQEYPGSHPAVTDIASRTNRPQ